VYSDYLFNFAVKIKKSKKPI
jgi:hypothetical protein